MIKKIPMNLLFEKIETIHSNRPGERGKKY